jgi:outer membrane PBP1 activator LpoA protein
MRSLIVAAALVLAACASAEPASEPASAPAASQAASQSQTTYQDAQSSASESDVRTARRAYRDACRTNGGSADRCECLTSSLAQTLSPADLNAETARLSGGAAPSARDQAARMSLARTQADAACTQFR